MITYRKAEQGDEKSFIAIEKDFYKVWDELKISIHLSPMGYQSIPEQSLKDDFKECLSEDCFFLAADNDGEMVGYIFAKVIPTPSTHPDYYQVKTVGHIDSVYVADEFRGQGVGTELIRRAHDWFKSKNVTISTLVAREENGKAVGLYEKMGFHRDTKVGMWKQI